MTELKTIYQCEKCERDIKSGDRFVTMQFNESDSKHYCSNRCLYIDFPDYKFYFNNNTVQLFIKSEGAIFGQTLIKIPS